MKYKFVESETELKHICDELLKEKIIGVDLEADSLHCFKEKICLIQIATADQAFIIDPFKIKTITVFLKILDNENIIKIFHGADFDIRSLDRDYHARVNNLFDTEIACRFLGLKERGLGSLLERNFNITSNKKYQKADWSMRPIKPEMIKYSVMDVAYLTKLYDIIHKKLMDNGRYLWAKEEFEIQEQVRYKSNQTLPLFQKFKGAGKMDGRTLAVLENLLLLRMQIAQTKDQPLFKIISNASLTTLSIHKPATVEQILKVKALSARQADMYGQQCVEVIKKALNIEKAHLPTYPKIKRPGRDSKIDNTIRNLKKLREKLSNSMGIEPGFLLNNASIFSIACNKPEKADQLFNIPHIRHWQVENIGDDIVAAC